MTQEQINTLADKIISAAGELKAANGQSFDKDKFQVLKERENKWHEISMNQLSFYNNLLIVLGTGFLAFVIKEFKPAGIAFSWAKAEWYATTITISICSMTVSIFLGLLCGFNRLVDFRYTHRVNNLRRKLYDKNFVKYGEGNYNLKLKSSWRYWFKDADFFKAAETEYNGEATSVKDKISGCSKLIDQLGKLTRNLLRWQIALFLIAILFFVISFI